MHDLITGVNYSTHVLADRQFIGDRQKNFVYDRRPVFECRQNAIVWRRRRWRVGSRQPGSLGRGWTDIDEQAWRSCSWRASL